jgi:hypothetical protein
VNEVKAINLATSGSRDLSLLMHVAVQAARHSVETLGDLLDETDLVVGLEYPAYSVMHLEPSAFENRDIEGRANAVKELAQAAKFLHAFGLADLLTLKEGYYIRLLRHIEDFMDYQK